MPDTHRTTLEGRRPDRASRAAGELRIGDYVHDDLAPFVVASFPTAPPHIVAVRGRLASGTYITVRYGRGRALDVTRMVPTTAARRRHLFLAYSRPSSPSSAG